MFADLNHDGFADVCGRGVGGIVCALSTGSSLGPNYYASEYFSDSKGWNQLVYYGSIRIGDVNGDGYADACGRGTEGIVCALNNGNGNFAAAVNWSNGFSDFGVWGYSQYATTIMLGNIGVSRVAGACGRSAVGIICQASNGSGRFQ